MALPPGSAGCMYSGIFNCRTGNGGRLLQLLLPQWPTLAVSAKPWVSNVQVLYLVSRIEGERNKLVRFVFGV